MPDENSRPQKRSVANRGFDRDSALNDRTWSFPIRKQTSTALVIALVVGGVGLIFIGGAVLAGLLYWDQMRIKPEAEWVTFTPPDGRCTILHRYHSARRTSAWARMLIRPKRATLEPTARTSKAGLHTLTAMTEVTHTLSGDRHGRRPPAAAYASPRYSAEARIETPTDSGEALPLWSDPSQCTCPPGSARRPR
jgi:hypothetical protein